MERLSIWFVLVFATTGCTDHRENHEQTRRFQDQERTKAWINALGGRAQTDANVPGHPITLVDVHGEAVTDFQMARLTVLSDHLTALALSGTAITAAGLVHLHRMNNLETLILWDNNVGDRGLPYLSDLRRLQSLVVGHCGLSDAGVKGLESLEISFLDLSGNNISDSGLLDLARLKNLKILRLQTTEVTDQGLLNLRSSDHLRFLILDDARVTPRGVRAFQAILPKCDVVVMCRRTGEPTTYKRTGGK